MNFLNLYTQNVDNNNVLVGFNTGIFVKLPITETLAVQPELLYTITVILIIFWAVGFFAYSSGSIIHILLVISVIEILLRLIQGKIIYQFINFAILK